MSDERLLTRPFVFAFVACFVQAMAFHMYLHLPGFLIGLGADEFTIGLIAASAAIAAILARPAVGRLMDLRGRRMMILLGGSLNTMSLCLYFTVHEIGPWIYCVRILQGVSQAMLFSAYFTIAADAIPESRRTQGIGLFGISGMLPLGLGPSLGDWILARGGYPDFFSVSIVLAAISLLLSLGIHDVRLHDPEQLPARPFLRTVSQPSLVPLWFIGGAFTTASASAFVFLKTYVLEFGLNGLGGFFLAYSAAAILLRLLLGWLPDRVGPKRVFFPALGLLAIGLFSIPHSGTELGLMLSGFFCGLGHGFCVPILTGLVVSRARDSERGAAMSMSTAIFDIGFLFGGPLWGFVISSQGYPAMYSAAMALIAAGATIFWAWDRGNDAVRELALEP